jgi:sugar diacid utilization regulator
VRWCCLPGEFPLGREPLQALLRRPSARAQLRALAASVALPPGASTPGAVALPGRPELPGGLRTAPASTNDAPGERALAGGARGTGVVFLARGLSRLVAALPLRQGAAAYLSLIVAGPDGALGGEGATSGAASGAAAGLAEALAQVAPLFALALARQHDLAGAERQWRTETLDALLAGTYADEAQMRARAEQVGYDLGSAQVALVVDLSGRDGGAGEPTDARAATVARVADALASELAGAWARGRGREVVALVPAAEGGTPGELAELARQVTAVLGRTLGPAASDWSAGLGQPAKGAAEARRSYTEARDSARLGAEVLGARQVARVADLGIYRLLLRLREAGELEPFCRQTLSPLRFDTRNGAALLETLEVFFACNGNHSAAARQLHLHRNSLIYRLTRARALLGHDLEDPETRLALQLALKGRRVLGW